MFFWFSLDFPLFQVPYSTVVFDKDNNLLGAHIAADGQWRFPQGDSVPQKFIACLLTFEDEHFYKHPGVNPLALFRASYQNRITSYNVCYTKLLRNNSKLHLWKQNTPNVMPVLFPDLYNKLYDYDELPIELPA